MVERGETYNTLSYSTAAGAWSLIIIVQSKVSSQGGLLSSSLAKFTNTTHVYIQAQCSRLTVMLVIEVMMQV